MAARRGKPRTAGYQEGPGFDRAPFSTGYQQGTLFRREAPARANKVREQEHLVPYDENTVVKGDSFLKPVEKIAKYNWVIDRYEPVNREDVDMLDARRLNGRVTGTHGVDLGTGLYHGTAARLKPGSLINPGHAQNFAPGMSADTKRENVFATNTLVNAYHYAKTAKEVRENRGSAAKGSVRAHVYRVQPTGPVSYDREDEDARTGYSEPGTDEPELQFQSRHPLRVLHEVQFGAARKAYQDYMGTGK